jgi:hypothetical protein
MLFPARDRSQQPCKPGNSTPTPTGYCCFLRTHHRFEPLWVSSVDRTACWCLEQAWRLPQLSERVTPWLRMMQVHTGSQLEFVC